MTTAETPRSIRNDARLAKAMSSPVRIRILGMLNEAVLSPKQVAERLGEPLENVSYHVRLLRDLGCIELVRTEKRRGATAHFYRATTRAFIDSTASSDLDLEARAAITSTILRESFRLAYTAAARGTFDSRTDRHLSMTNLTLTEAGWGELNAVLDEVVETALRLQAEALSPEAADEDKVRTDLVLAHFPAAPAD